MLGKLPSVVQSFCLGHSEVCQAVPQMRVTQSQVICLRLGQAWQNSSVCLPFQSQSEGPAPQVG